MLLDPSKVDWRHADASEVFYAARDGVPQAQAELRRRDAIAKLRDAKAKAKS